MKIEYIITLIRRVFGQTGHKKVRTQDLPVMERLEPRLLLSYPDWQVQPGHTSWPDAVVSQFQVARMPDLPGLAPVVEDPYSLAGQVIYLDADGQYGLEYQGPVHIGPVDIKGLRLEGRLSGMEQEVLTAAVDILQGGLAQAGITFVTERPRADQAFSTVYISSDKQAFERFGGYLGLAEGVDVGNLDRQDDAIVFVNDLTCMVDLNDAASIIASRVGHELGHLLGYVHLKDVSDIRSGLVEMADYTTQLANLAHEAGVDDRYVTYGPTRQQIEAKDTYVHQWIALEAWRFYNQQYRGSELQEYLGTIPGSNDDRWYPVGQAQFSGDDLLEGVYEEDTLGIWLRHFVQGGDEEELLIGLAKLPKDDNIILQTLLKGSINGMVTDPADGRYLSAYEAAQALWQQAIDAYTGGQKGLSYYYLGRVAHLLSDMCTPAHVHLDRHAAVQGDGDYYELITASDKQFMLWGIGRQRGGPAGQIPLYSDLQGLFSTTINYTQEYPSWNLAGKLQVPGLDRDDIVNTGRHRPDLVGPQYGWNMEDYWIVADDLMPWAMEQTAALYRLFYSQIDKEGPILQFTSEIGTSEALALLASARLRIEVMAQDPISGLASDGPTFFIERKIAGEWRDVGSFTCPNGILKARLQEDGLYRIRATATDAAGNTSLTPSGYLLVEDALTCPPLITVDPLQTTDPSPRLAGTLDDPNATVTIQVAGSSYRAINNGDGTWTLPAGTIRPLAKGSYDIVATAQDLRGNVGIDQTADELWIVLLEERFDGGLDGWTIWDQGTKAGPSRWRVEEGQLAQLANIYGNPSGVSRLGTSLIYGAGVGWTDYQVHLTISSQDDDDIGVIFRVKDTRNYYRFSWNKQLGYRRLVRSVDGKFSIVASDQVPYQMGVQYRICIKAHGPLLQVYVDDQLVLSAVDQTFSKGTVGLYCWGNQGSYFDDLVVEELTNQNIPPVIMSIQVEPALITDRQSAVAKVQATDYDGQQMALRYLWTCNRGHLLEPTSTQCIYIPPDVEGLESIILQVQVSDGIKTTSSWVEVYILDADTQRLLTEGFEDNDMQGWAVVQEGSWPVRARWYCSKGVLVENSGTSRPNDGIAARGTYAFYKDGASWTDYILRVQLCSKDTKDLGLMFRYIDKDNYYRFSWNSSRGHARLVRCLGGRFESLADVAFRYVKNRVYTITVVAYGQDLRVLVDGLSLLTYKDGILPTGSIALYSRGNKGSMFDQIEVYSV